jgi:hypothetical protein
MNARSSVRTRAFRNEPGLHQPRTDRRAKTHNRPSYDVRASKTGGQGAPTGLVASGVVELAAGALTGWLYTIAKYDVDRARAMGIKNAARVRQGHLDLAMLGTATIAMGLAVPAAPRWMQRALGAGAWANAVLFFPLAFRPEAINHPAYRGITVASFVSTSLGFSGMAVTALRRRRAAHR